MPLDSVLTVNGGSSTIKFALYGGASLNQRLRKAQVNLGEDWMAQLHDVRPDVVAHRIVHGGLRLIDHQLITPSVLDTLREAQQLDLAHLPGEIALIEECARHFPDVPQVACFDTAFHRDLPSVAQLFPIPRRFLDEGVRRFGFHGLSYTYLMEELRNVAPDEANGRVILAHLGAGASMAAVSAGRPIDTTMAFTPCAGLVMGTRPGDLDPGLVTYMMSREKLTPEAMDEMLNGECGLAGVSGISGDMRELSRQSSDPRAADAIELFCYSARKWIGALSAALGGLDTLVFSGGIGEHDSDIRASVCQPLEYLGLRIDPAKNQASDGLISAANSRVAVRVIATDEEAVMARIVQQVLGGGGA